jgi:purine-binding chemotaxis protein CheW
MAPSETRPPHLLFACGARWYAVPAPLAAEVVTFPELTRVPGAPVHLLGVFDHRGEVVPVVDLGQLVDGAPQPSQRAVLVRVARGVVGLTASAVDDVADATGEFLPHGDSGVRRHLLGPVQAGGRSVLVIEPEGLFDFLGQRPHGGQTLT